MGQLEVLTGLSQMGNFNTYWFLKINYIEGGIKFQWPLLFFNVIYCPHVV